MYTHMCLALSVFLSSQPFQRRPCVPTDALSCRMTPRSAATDVLSVQLTPFPAVTDALSTQLTPYPPN